MVGIQASVSSIFTLVAFLAAAVVWSYRRRLMQMERLAKLAPEEDRRQVIEMILDRVSVDTSNLTRQQRYDLALRLIENRTHRFKTLSVIVIIVAVVAAMTATLALRAKWAEEQERSPTASLVVPPSDAVPEKMSIHAERYTNIRRLGERLLADYLLVKLHPDGSFDIIQSKTPGINLVIPESVLFQIQGKWVVEEAEITQNPNRVKFRFSKIAEFNGRVLLQVDF